MIVFCGYSAESSKIGHHFRKNKLFQKLNEKCSPKWISINENNFHKDYRCI